MKNAIHFFGLFLAIIFVSCEGPAGPPGFDGLDGRDGLDGQDGINILGKVLEIEGDFNVGNDYSLFYEFPQTVEVFESDVVLVYILWDQTEDGNGEPVDIWRLLPQTRILDQGLLQYNFDHTFLDVNIFLESDFDLATLQPGDTDNQIFRIAIMPADFNSGAKMNVSDMSAVMSRLNIKESDINRVKLN
ncbi:MAG: collagen-like protein [Flavobacteriaceae bacterium]